MLIKKIDDIPSEPWKNGGGVTRTLAADDQHTPAHWRISVANIHASGPFSRFDGVDRVSILLEGKDLRLHSGSDTHFFRTVGDSFAYRGEEPTNAQLGSDACRFLNVMTQRGTCAVELERDTPVLKFSGLLSVLVVPLLGSIEVRPHNMVLSAGECLLLSANTPSLSIAPLLTSASWFVLKLRQSVPDIDAAMMATD